MEDSTLIIIVIAVVLVIAVVIILVVYATSQQVIQQQTNGKNSRGTWKLIQTPVGPLQSYYFSGAIANSQGQFLGIIDGEVVLSQERFYWTFDGQYLFGANVYVSVDSSNQVFLSPTPVTSWLFDSYNFYLVSSIVPNQSSVLYLDPLTLNILQGSFQSIYKPTSTFWNVNGV